MIIPDANLLLYASDSSSPFHRAATAWWSGCLSGGLATDALIADALISGFDTAPSFTPPRLRPVSRREVVQPDHRPPRLNAGAKLLYVQSGAQHVTQLWLFFEPSRSRRATVSGIGETRCTGPLAMSAVVWPRRLTAVTSAPCPTK